MYNIEQNLRDICGISNNNATVFCAFNLTVNLLSKLKCLHREEEEENSKTFGIGSYEDLTTPYWVLSV